MPVQARIFIVRHGETEWNRTRRIQGQLDVPLNETGLKQAMLVGEALKAVPFARAFSSDLQRASKTAECILQYHPNVVLERDSSIRERYVGELQGEIPHSKKPAPSMETVANFASRCLAWYLQSVVDDMISSVQAANGVVMQHPRNILVVSHGAWISVLLSALRANGLVTCRRGVEIGSCLNTGVSIIEYSKLCSGRDDALMGTLVQFSGAEHLAQQNLHIQEVNADVLCSREWKR